jgi:hypothetical protein
VHPSIVGGEDRTNPAVAPSRVRGGRAVQRRRSSWAWPVLEGAEVAAAAARAREEASACPREEAAAPARTWRRSPHRAAACGVLRS